MLWFANTEIFLFSAKILIFSVLLETWIFLKRMYIKNYSLFLAERNINMVVSSTSCDGFVLGKDTLYPSLCFVLFCFSLILICFQVHGMISTVAVLNYSSVKGLTELFAQLLLPPHHHQRVGVQKTGFSLIIRCSMKSQYTVLKTDKQKYKTNIFGSVFKL